MGRMRFIHRRIHFKTWRWPHDIRGRSAIQMRTVLTQDSIPWLADHINCGAIVTSLPDAEEMEMPIWAWRDWFVGAAGACMASVDQDQPSIFYQTDRKADGGIESKAHLLFNASRIHGLRVIWHKIALRRQVDCVDLFRPTYTHLIAFSRRCKVGSTTPDVIHRGTTLYKNGMGVEAARVAVQFAGRTSKTIIDPFCGRGTVLAVAEEEGFDAIGIDIDPEQVEFARTVQIKEEEAIILCPPE